MIETLEKYYEDGLLHRQVHPTLDLTIWNYSPKVQYEKLWDEVTIQCRGLVTNSKGEIVATMQLGNLGLLSEINMKPINCPSQIILNFLVFIFLKVWLVIFWFAFAIKVVKSETWL